MNTRDIGEMALLGSMWGGSFIFMRVAAPEFGPLPLMATRVLLASLFLIPVFLHAGNGKVLWQYRADLALMGLLNSALPFVLFAWATLSLTAGYTAVINACAPLFTAVVAFLWVGERLSGSANVGLLVGLGGVTALVWDELSLASAADSLPMVAALLAALSYGVAANHARVRLQGVGSLEITTGSQLASTLLLVPVSLFYLPSTLPSANAWLAALILGVPCTGIAYILFFRLLARLGPARAMTVTYIVPLAAMVCGAVFLREPVTIAMLVGCSLILLGTALATGLLTVNSLLRRF